LPPFGWNDDWRVTQSAFRRIDSMPCGSSGAVTFVVHSRDATSHPVARLEPRRGPVKRPGASLRAIPLSRERCVSPTSATDSVTSTLRIVRLPAARSRENSRGAGASGASGLAEARVGLSPFAFPDEPLGGGPLDGETSSFGVAAIDAWTLVGGDCHARAMSSSAHETDTAQSWRSPIGGSSAQRLPISAFWAGIELCDVASGVLCHGLRQNPAFRLGPIASGRHDPSLPWPRQRRRQ
jgi:hypothetical protein